jgi:hypothetical protein
VNPVPSVARPAGLRETGLRGAVDPTVPGARLFPEALDEARGWGSEPGGGVRAIVAGVRIVSTAGSAMLVASDRLPATPSTVLALPERLGSGFLFAIGTHLWTAASWLGPGRAIYTSPLPIAQLLIGLDRVYVRSPQGILVAIDPTTGNRVSLGPVPSSPNIGRLAAFDAWRAIVVADMRGTLLTLDAGATWRPLALPIDPGEVVLLGDTIAVGGVDGGRQVQWWEVTADGQTARLSSIPTASPPPERGPAPTDTVSRAFGPRPLVAAIEDGWPLADGTVLVARDGALARVRLTDGALVESVADAFPLKPARCKALSLSRRDDPGALGFVCGESRGRTLIYRWDASGARLVELQRFENPREVLGFANGALAVRGSCAPAATQEPIVGEQIWCVMPSEGAWRDMRSGTDERIVVLSDARVVLIRPPRGGDLSRARLTVIDGGRQSDLPLALPPLRADVANALRLGVWLDGFEERKAGVVGGWVDAAGAIVGIEIATNGETRVGEYIRDAGAPIASGRWAFGWTASRRGFETTDGGMTWTKEIALPDPIAAGRAPRERACGPVGCVAAGWLRVGWGASAQPLASEPRPIISPPRPSPPNLELDCEMLTVPPHEPATMQATGATAVGRPATVNTYAGSACAPGSPLPPFAGHPGPSMALDDFGLSVESSNGLERALRGMPLARLYVWGPKTGDWYLGRWQVRWQWPWSAWSDVRASTASAAVWPSLDSARRALCTGPGSPVAWFFAEGDDRNHALLLARHATATPTVDLVVLEADHPAVAAHRPGAEPFPEVEGAARLGGRWYIATSQSPGELAATVVWSIEGKTAREIVRVPRAGFETRPALRIARRSDAHALGLVVDGQPDESNGPVRRWVTAIDVESNAVATPEPLAPIDLSDRTVSPCSGDDPGWEVDLPYPGTIRLHVGANWESELQSTLVRMRLSHDRACIERALGAVEAYSDVAPEALTLTRGATAAAAPRGREAGRTIDVSIVSARRRYGLRCTARR